jgi:hypothetical protein
MLGAGASLKSRIFSTRGAGAVVHRLSFDIKWKWRLSPKNVALKGCNKSCCRNIGVPVDGAKGDAP